MRSPAGGPWASAPPDDAYVSGVNTRGVRATRDLSNQPITLNSPTDPFNVSMNIDLDAAPTTELIWSLSLLSGGCGGPGRAFLPRMARFT